MVGGELEEVPAKQLDTRAAKATKPTPSATLTGDILLSINGSATGTLDEFNAVVADLPRDQVIPALVDFAPDMLFISAGFDGHTDDPLAGLDFTTDDYGWLTGLLCDFAADSCQGRVVSALEGGYNLQALADSVSLHVKTLMTYA